MNSTIQTEAKAVAGLNQTRTVTQNRKAYRPQR
jgi:hypothetical protein